MSNLDSDPRALGRKFLTKTVVVKGRESIDDFWKETAELVNVSRVGASFNIQHECAPGRVLSLLMNSPKELRLYDRNKRLYRVWGLVQHCQPISLEEGESGFQIGVAFVGKHPPDSYAADPLKSYRISGIDEDGFWNVGETKTPFVSRAHHRFSSRYNAPLTLIGADGEEEASDEEAVTDNISLGGAAVFSTLDANSGDRVKFVCDSYDYSSICVVTNRQNREGGLITLHLQFVEPDFPIDRLALLAESEDMDEDEDSNDTDEQIEESDQTMELESSDDDSETVEGEGSAEGKGDDTEEE